MNKILPIEMEGTGAQHLLLHNMVMALFLTEATSPFSITFSTK